MEGQNDEISLGELIQKVKEWWNYLLSQKKIIILAVLIGASAGVLYSIIKKPTYKASLSFVLEDEKKAGGSLGSALGLASSLGLDLGGDPSSGMFFGANLNELLKSRLMLEKTLLAPVTVNKREISLAEMYIQINKIRKGWEDKPKFRNIQFLPNTDRKYFTRIQDSILNTIQKSIGGNLMVQQKDKKVSITTIEFISTDELFSKYFCEALAQEVSSFYINTKSKKARTNMDILIKQRDSTRVELNRAITGAAQASDNNYGLNPAYNVLRTNSTRKQIDIQANTAILTELIKQAEMAKVSLRRETPLIQVIDKPILPLEKQRVGKLKGIIVGGFLAGFLTVIYLIMRKIFSEVLK